MFKYGQGIENSNYDYYHNFDIEFSYNVYDSIFDVAIMLGQETIYYDDLEWDNSGGSPDQPYLGIRTFIYPINAKTFLKSVNIRPFVGLKAVFLSQKAFLSATSGNMYSEPGLYSPKSRLKNYFALSFGPKILIGQLVFLIELETAYRNFDLTYLKYSLNNDGYIIEEEIKIPKSYFSYLFNIGV